MASVLTASAYATQIAEADVADPDVAEADVEFGLHCIQDGIDALIASNQRPAGP